MKMVIIMRKVQRILPVLLITLLAGCSSTTAPQAPANAGPQPSGTFHVRDDEVMRLAAGAAGEGTLIFQGWQHSFKFENAKVTIVGGGEGQLNGTVYNLENVEDFEGTYLPTKTDLVAGKGLGVWAKNAKGVELFLDYTGLDLQIDLEATGATVTLNK